MKTKTKTKSTVARRRVKRRQERVSHKKLRTLRSRKYARKTARKVMRGGADKITAYVLYDAIPFQENKEKQTSSINVPICVILIKPKTPKDDIYLFFNSQMTIEDIVKTVKLLLGIPNENNFELTPPIQERSSNDPLRPCGEDDYNLYIDPRGAVYKCTRIKYETVHYSLQQERLKIPEIPRDSLMRSLGSTIVKLSGIMSYTISSGTFKNINLDTAGRETPHTITTTDTNYKSLNGGKIKDFLSNKDNGFMKKVLDSRGVLPDLYKEYFTPITEKEVDDKVVDEKFGKDEEDKNSYSYIKFKDEMKQKIQEKLDDMINHKTFGLDAQKVQTLETRPLEITDPIDIQIDESESLKNIINKIDVSIAEQATKKILFTNLSKKWWTQEEKYALWTTQNQVSKEKKKRVDECFDREGSRECRTD